ncbi:MAG TPA: SNF2-related protein [Solirubrobacterales bacterium]|jgi:ribosomal protein S27AE
MPVSTPSPTAPTQGKRSALTGAALSDEVFDSSPSLLRPSRGDRNTVAGLQQFFSPPEAADLIAAVNGREQSTVDLTAGDGSLLMGVEPDFRFGIEIDADQVKARTYEAIHGDLQRAYPLLRLLRAQFTRVACNPPFGLDWQINGRKENSMVATWRMANALLADQGAGSFIAGRDRFARDVLSRPDASGVYALIECRDLFDGVELPCAIAFFVLAGNAQQPREDGPLRLSASRADLPGLAQEIRAERERVASCVAEPFRCSYRAALAETFKTVSKELARRREGDAAKRQRYDLELKGNRVSARPSPFARLALGQRRGLREVERLNGQPNAYFALNLREWRQLKTLAAEDALTLQPALCEAIEAATTQAEQAVCPLYEVRPQQRLAFLDDLDSILCVASDPERGFEAGERYPLETSSDVTVSHAERPHHKRNGDVEIRRYEHEAKVLRVDVDGQVFNESAADVTYLLEHFELPDPGDLGTRFPDQVEEARGVLCDLAERNDFEFKTSEVEEWQLEDLARLVVKGSGVLGWEQGGGKSLGGATLIHALWERGAARKGLIVCPQDLILQWKREIRRFYGEEPEHITTPAQARAVARHLRSGGTGLYITHYEVLSLIGRVDEPLPLAPVSASAAEHEEEGRTALTSEEFCPNCLASFDAGWQRRSPYVCERCHYVHKRLRVKTAGHYLAHAFADGVIVVDEGTLAKGNDSLRSKAVRGLRARHRFLLTGTPISNYVNDVFWLLWWTLGNATLRFPFDYEGGRAKFEADFCVIEYWRRDGRRENRKVLPQVTNVSRLWRLLSGAMVRRRKQHMGKLAPRTTRTIAAPMGEGQMKLYEFWLSGQNFERYFTWKHPGHPMLAVDGLVERFAAGLGQLTKLEYATTLPEADPDLGSWEPLQKFEHSNWTPKNLKVLQVALEHVEAGEKVLIGSDLIETGRWLCERLREKGVEAAHIVEERSGRAQTMNPRRRAKAIEAFKTGRTQVLCCGIPSIRLGHSLEAASCVIANGLVFSYEMFDQFIARAWRLTSPGPVSVYVALTLGSLDPRKWELLCQKAKAADLALDGQLVDEPEKPISREEFLRELRKQGVKPTGEEIAEADIRSAWEATASLEPTFTSVRTPSNGDSGARTVAWHEASSEPIEQLDLFAPA